MNVLELIEEVKTLGFSLSVKDNDRLLIHPDVIGVPIGLLDKLKEFKHEIITFLKYQRKNNNNLCLTKYNENKLPLTHAQLRLWFSENSNNKQHLIRGAFEIVGKFEVNRFKTALSHIISQLRVLRLSIVEEMEGAYQQVSQDFNIDEFFQHISHPGSDIKSYINNLLLEKLSYDKPLFKIILLEVNPSHFFLIIKTHHLILDGISLSYLFKWLEQEYNLDCKLNFSGQFDYLDFAAWEQTENAKQYYCTYLDYWLNYLEDFEALDLPKMTFDNSWLHTASAYQLKLDVNLVRLIKECSSAYKVTPNTIYLCALYLVLSKYVSKTDLMVGIPMGNRFSEDIREMIGLFVNTLPVRVNLDGCTTVSLLKMVQKNLLNAQQYSQVPFDLIFEKLPPEQKKINLFEVIFNYLDGEDEIFNFSDAKITPVFTEAPFIQNLINFAVRPQGEQCVVNIDYDVSHFSFESIQRLGEYFINALKEIVTHNIPLNEISLIGQKESDLLLNIWNKTQKKYRSETLAERLKESFGIYAHRQAVLCDSGLMTYQDLGARSKSVASALQAYGISKGDFVVTYLERSSERVAILCGIILAGAAYIPVEVNTPKNRLLDIIEDANARVIIVDSMLKVDCPKIDNVQMLTKEEILYFDKKPLHAVCYSGDDIAYIIYTSGSTGKPKGVLIQHKGIINRLEWMQDKYQLDKKDRVMQKTSYSFDVSVWEFFWPLLFGASIVVPKEDGHKDPEYLLEQIETHRVTTIHFVPSMLTAFLNAVNIKKCSFLRQIICSGEALQRKDVNTILKESNINIHNLYGPTEASIDVTYHNCMLQEAHLPVPIGKPIANIKTYILDKNLLPAPIGVPGELYLSGIGLALGYLKRPELTKEKFIVNPFSNEFPYERLYKTGDLTKWGEDGNIYYLGRLDYQIKLRGLRIELGEIENSITRYPGVNQSLVLVKTVKGNKHLVAYYSGFCNVDQQLREFLQDILPEYMLPSYFVHLQRFPINKNGKIGRKEIERLAVNGFTQKNSPDILPRNHIEITIADVWSKVLGLKTVYVYDNFFHLGGDSISLMQVITILRKKGINLPIKKFFEIQILEELAANAIIQPFEKGAVNKICGKQELTPIQYWFFDGTDNIHFWNQLFRLQANQPIDKEKFKKAVDYVTNYHDIFSLKFKNVDGGWKAEYQNGNNYIFEDHDLTGLSHENQLKLLQTTGEKFYKLLNIIHGPLAAFVHFKLGKNNERVLIIINHLIIDGVSWRILIEDLSQAYQNLIDGDQIKLAYEKSASYQEWGEKCKKAEITTESYEYWKYFADQHYDEVKAELSNGDNNYSSNQKIRVLLNKSNTKALLSNAVRNYEAHINAVLLAPLALTLGEVAQLKNFLVEVESHGRMLEGENLDITRTLGWFTSIYPIILNGALNVSNINRIKAIDTYLDQVPNKGNDFLKLKYCSNEGVFLKNLQPDISFNYLGQFHNSIFQNTMFEMAEEYYGMPVAPENKRKHKFDIVAVIVNDELRIDWNYSSNLFREETIRKMANKYLDHLKNIIDIS